VIALISATWDEITLLKRDVQVTEEGSNGELKYRIGELSGQSILLAVAGKGAGFISQPLREAGVV